MFLLSEYKFLVCRIFYFGKYRCQTGLVIYIGYNTEAVMSIYFIILCYIRNVLDINHRNHLVRIYYGCLLVIKIRLEVNNDVKVKKA